MSTAVISSLEPDDLARVTTELTVISENLLASYGRLARHAERVESELVVANTELARRVAEVDALRLHLDTVRRALPCGVVVLRADGVMASANPRALALLGCDESELLRHGNDLLAAATFEGSMRDHVLADGSRRVLAVRRSPLPGPVEGGAVITIDDRTEERRLSAELASTSKMVALGTMAGGIAHEVRNPLNAVRGFASLLCRELEATSRAHRFARRIQQGVDEVEAIVASLLGFAAPEKLVRETVATEALVAEAVALALQEQSTRAHLWSITTELDVAEIRIDRIKMRQALRNLVANAIQSQPNGGRVVVALRLVDECFEMRVHDAGPGLAPQLAGRVGEPFLTTRAEGTGLGLALVHAIAAVHGGRFEILATPGPLGGVDARLRIPRKS